MKRGATLLLVLSTASGRRGARPRRRPEDSGQWSAPLALAAGRRPHEPALDRQGALLGRLRGRAELAAHVRPRHQRDHAQALRPQPLLLRLLAARGRAAVHRRRPRVGQQRASRTARCGTRTRAPRTRVTDLTEQPLVPDGHDAAGRPRARLLGRQHPGRRHAAGQPALLPVRLAARDLQPDDEHLPAADRRAGSPRRCTRSCSCSRTAASSTPGPTARRTCSTPTGTGTMSNGPVSPFDGSSAVMYAPGKVMKSGTWSDPSFAGRTSPAAPR